METIIVISLAIIVALVAISQIDIFGRECLDAKILFNYKVFAFSLFAIAILDVFMILTYGLKTCYLLYAINRIASTIMMLEIVVLTRCVVNVEDKYISVFMSCIIYGAVILFFIDTFVQGGILNRGLFGVFFKPEAPWHMALYFIFYMCYIVLLATFAVSKATISVKKREKREVYYLYLTYIFGVAGLIGELFVVCYSDVYFPVALIFEIPFVVFMRKFLIYHQSIDVRESMFDKELNPERTDITFILDDQMNILYQNKRAQVYGLIVKDEFLGRKLSQVFEISDDVCKELYTDPDEVPFGISTEYTHMNKHVNMVIQHRIDSCGDILATGVYVYNLEENVQNEKADSLENEENDEQIICAAISITQNARALLVDEDPVFANAMERMLGQYGIKTVTAADGLEAIEIIKNQVFDIVLVSYEMEKLSGFDMVSKVRKMNADYFRQVPVVYMTQMDINEIYSKFIESGFNDYLAKPITHKNLAMVLTRWLWQRFDNDKTDIAESEYGMSALNLELNRLLVDATKWYSVSDYEMLDYCVHAISVAAEKLNYKDLADAGMQLREVILLKEYGRVDALFEKVSDGIKEAVTING